MSHVPWRLKSSTTRLFVQQFVEANDNGLFTGLRGKSTDDRWISLTKGQQGETLTSSCRECPCFRAEGHGDEMGGRLRALPEGPPLAKRVLITVLDCLGFAVLVSTKNSLVCHVDELSSLVHHKWSFFIFDNFRGSKWWKILQRDDLPDHATIVGTCNFVPITMFPFQYNDPKTEKSSRRLHCRHRRRWRLSVWNSLQCPQWQ